MTPAQRLDRYIGFLENLTRAKLTRLGDFVTPDVRFADPFHDVTGREAMRAIFERMFEDVGDLRFRAHTRSASDEFGFFSWVLEGRLGNRPWRATGITEVAFCDDGAIRAHIDHWDAASQLYERFPLIGPLLRQLRRRIAARV